MPSGVHPVSAPSHALSISPNQHAVHDAFWPMAGGRLRRRRRVQKRARCMVIDE